MIALSGCASQPLVYQANQTLAEDPNCRKVWIWTANTNHSEVVIRISDIPAEWQSLTAPYAFPEWARFVGFGIYDIAYLAGDVSRLRALLPSPGGMAVRFFRDSPELNTSPTKLTPLILPAEALEQILAYVDRDIARDVNGMSIYAGEDALIAPDPAATEYVMQLRTITPYSATNICHDWVRRSLKAAGFEGIPMMVYSAPQLLDILDAKYPRHLQSCPGYENRTKEERRNQPFTRKS